MGVQRILGRPWLLALPAVPKVWQLRDIQSNGQHPMWACRQWAPVLRHHLHPSLRSQMHLPAVPPSHSVAHRLTLKSGVHRTNLDSWNFPNYSFLLSLRLRETNGNTELSKKGLSYMLQEADRTWRFLQTEHGALSSRWLSLKPPCWNDCLKTSQLRDRA